jgi:hypothetical protein
MLTGLFADAQLHACKNKKLFSRNKSKRFISLDEEYLIQNLCGKNPAS